MVNGVMRKIPKTWTCWGGSSGSRARQQRLTQSELARRQAQFPTLETPNVAFHNRRDGAFESVGAAWGFDVRGISQSIALADFDNDGDPDVVINNLQAVPTLLRNEGIAPRLAIQLKGRPPNRAGIGARIKVRGGPVEQKLRR